MTEKSVSAGGSGPNEIKDEVLSFGIGVTQKGPSGKVLEVFYALLFYRSDKELSDVIASVVGHTSGNAAYPLSRQNLEKVIQGVRSQKQSESHVSLLERLLSTKNSLVATFISDDAEPKSVEEVYLKLSLISHRLVKPREMNIDRIFEILPNVAWTSDGPVEVEDLAERQLHARLEGRPLTVFSIDKFPKMINHVIPSQVRIADGARVRLGAYLGAGTTVMQSGAVNFNAGTAGPNMVEGRISVGVFVDSGTDLGGGSSIMGTIYRDVDAFISIGKDCVIGANAGAGISLGDDCTIEAGLYVTAGTKVELLDKSGKRIGTVKARDLSGKPNLLFRRNSTNGQVEAMESEATVRLNEAFHTNR